MQTSYLIRFEWWVRLFIASIILLFSIFAYTDETWDIQGTLISSLSIVISFAGGIVSIVEETFQSSKRIESILIISSVSVWGIATTVSNLSPTLTYDYYDAGDSPTNLAQPNVYLFAYFCVVASVFLVGSWFQQYIQNEDSTTTTSWVLLGASSFIVMVAAIGIRDIRVEDIINELNSTISLTSPNSTVGGQDNSSTVIGEMIDLNATDGKSSFCSVTDTMSCARVDFAIILGGFSAACACLTAPWKNAPLGCLTDLSFLLFIAWGCGVGLLTFDNGPGHTMSTIYFASWFCLFLCLDILMNVSAQLSQKHLQREGHPGERPQDGGASRESSLSPAVITTTISQRNRPNEERNEFLETAFGHLGRQTRRLSAMPISVSSLSDSIFSAVGTWRGDITSGDWGGPSIHALDEQSLPSDAPDSEKLEDRDKLRSLQLWIALFITSLVCLAAVYPSLPEPGSRSPPQKLGIVAPSLAIVISCCGYLTNVRKGSSADKAELVVVFLSIVTWAMGLTLIFLVEYDDGGFSRFQAFNSVSPNAANAFFGVWCGFLFSLLLATKWFRASITVRDWVLLCAFSLCLFVSSLLFYREDTPTQGNMMDAPTCEVIERFSCSRVLFGICLGLISATISMIMLFWTSAPSVAHVTVGSLLFGAWCCAVGLLTFGSGHGFTAGSVYFESWAGLFLTLDVATTNGVLLLRQRQAEKNNDPQEGYGIEGNDSLAAVEEGKTQEEEDTMELTEQ